MATKLAANMNNSGVRTGQIPVPVKGMPSGSAKGRPALKAGDGYGSDIKAAGAAGFKEGMMGGADDASGAATPGRTVVS